MDDSNICDPVYKPVFADYMGAPIGPFPPAEYALQGVAENKLADFILFQEIPCMLKCSMFRLFCHISLARILS